MPLTLHPMHDPELSRMQAEGFGSQPGKLGRRFAQA
jgi:hypothetical protein